MKLNTDLFRNVLLFLEAQSYYVSNCDGEIESMPVWFGKISEHFPNNDQAEVFYALKNLEQAGYINLTSCAADNAVSRCYVNCITSVSYTHLDVYKRQVYMRYRFSCIVVS